MSEDHKDGVLEALEEGANKWREAHSRLDRTSESNVGVGPGAQQRRSAEARAVGADSNMRRVIREADEMSCISKKEMRCYTRFSDDQLDQFRAYDED